MSTKFKIKMRKMKSTQTYDEALALSKNGWRLPTIFELIKLKEYAQISRAWSASIHSGDSSQAWVASHYAGFEEASNKRELNYVRLIRSEHKFDYTHKVSEREVSLFRQTDLLPEWHPPLEKSLR